MDGARENFVVIEKMHLLLVAHGDVRMFLEKIMQRCCPRFLRPRKDEIESPYFSPLLKHLLQVIITKGRLARPRRLARPINCAQLSRSHRRFMVADAKIISGRSRYRVGFFTVRG